MNAAATIRYGCGAWPWLSSSESPAAPVNSQPANCPPSGAHSIAEPKIAKFGLAERKRRKYCHAASGEIAIAAASARTPLPPTSTPSQRAGDSRQVECSSERPDEVKSPLFVEEHFRRGCSIRVCSSVAVNHVLLSTATQGRIELQFVQYVRKRQVTRPSWAAPAFPDSEATAQLRKPS
jgi:hypothetical protein